VTFLKEWVRGLVLLLLLAACLELVLPMHSMKKYVRMTMGLFLLLAVVRPVFDFLGQPVVADPALFTEAPGRGLPSLGEIMAQADRIRQQNQALAAAEVTVRLSAEAAQAARAVPGVADAAARVTMGPDAAKPAIQGVTVTIWPGSVGAVRPVQPVRPVSPVVPDADGTGTEPGTGTPARAPTPAEEPLAEAVRREVAARLSIRPDPAIIRVLVADRPSE
jgi:stage III sporulation protein AF